MTTSRHFMIAQARGGPQNFKQGKKDLSMCSNPHKLSHCPFVFLRFGRQNLRYNLVIVTDLSFNAV